MKIPDSRFKAAMIGGSAFVLVVSFVVHGCSPYYFIKGGIHYQKCCAEDAQRISVAITRKDPAISVDKLPLAILFLKINSQRFKDIFDHAAQMQGFDNFSDFLLDQPRQATPQEIKNVRTQFENEGFKFPVCDQDRSCVWETK